MIVSASTIFPSDQVATRPTIAAHCRGAGGRGKPRSAQAPGYGPPCGPNRPPTPTSSKHDRGENEKVARAIGVVPGL